MASSRASSAAAARSESSPNEVTVFASRYVLKDEAATQSVTLGHHDLEQVPGAHDDVFSLQGKLQCTFKDVRDLLILMTMQWDDTSLEKSQSGQHALLSRDKLSVKQGVQVLRGHVCKANVLDVGRLLCGCAHVR